MIGYVIAKVGLATLASPSVRTLEQYERGAIFQELGAFLRRETIAAGETRSASTGTASTNGGRGASHA